MSTEMLTAESAGAFEQTITRGGIAVFPTDTLYGIACDPDDQAAADRIYELEGSPAGETISGDVLQHRAIARRARLDA